MPRVYNRAWQNQLLRRRSQMAGRFATHHPYGPDLVRVSCALADAQSRLARPDVSEDVAAVGTLLLRGGSSARDCLLERPCPAERLIEERNRRLRVVVSHGREITLAADFAPARLSRCPSRLSICARSPDGGASVSSAIELLSTQTARRCSWRSRAPSSTASAIPEPAGIGSASRADTRKSSRRAIDKALRNCRCDTYELILRRAEL
jgi:hypothetical protein